MDKALEANKDKKSLKNINMENEGRSLLRKFRKNNPNADKALTSYGGEGHEAMNWFLRDKDILKNKFGRKPDIMRKGAQEALELKTEMLKKEITNQNNIKSTYTLSQDVVV